jgi:hypothetical protein
MDIVNIDALIAQGRILDLANINQDEDYLVIGKYSNDYTTNSFKYTNYPVFAIKAKDLIAVSTDGVTITGDGTPSNPLVAASGTSTLQQVTDLGNTTTNDIELINDAEVIFGAGGGVLLDNSSRLREGTIDANLGGSKGIAQICAVGYELKWEAGRLYVMGSAGTTIRQSLYNFNNTPVATDDNTKGYQVNSLWTLDDNTTYICTNATTGAAVWTLQANVPTLQQVLNFNHDLVNGNNFQGTGAGVANTGTNVIASGGNAANGNAGIYVVAIGDSAAKDNTAVGSYTVAIGLGAGQENNGSETVAIGVSAAFQNTGAGLVAISTSAGNENEGNNVIAIGQNAASTNTSDNVIALGTDAGIANAIPQSFIISNDQLPSFLDRATALLTITGGSPGSTYLYYNQTTFAIEAVRFL